MKRKAPANDYAAFEEALTRQLAEHYRLRLFVTGSTRKSARAIQNIREICDAELAGRYDLEVIDIYQHPELAQPEQIVVAPTLVKRLPLPVRRLIGDLSDKQRVLVGLDLVRQSDSGGQSGDNGD